jgi:hypothetical protein
VILSRVCAGLGLAPDTLVSSGSIPDWSAITVGYREGVRTVYSMGLIGGVDSKGTFNPTGTLSRAQAATVLYRLLNAMDGTQPVWDAARVDPSATNMDDPVPTTSAANGLIRIQDWNPAAMTKSIAAGKNLAAQHLDPLGKPGFFKTTEEGLILGLMDREGNYVQYNTTLELVEGGYTCLTISEAVSDLPLWGEAAVPYLDAVLSESVAPVVRKYIIAMYRDMVERCLDAENGSGTRAYTKWEKNYGRKEYNLSELGYNISFTFGNGLKIYDTGADFFFESSRLPLSQWVWFNEANRP